MAVRRKWKKSTAWFAWVKAELTTRSASHSTISKYAYRHASLMASPLPSIFLDRTSATIARSECECECDR